MLALTRKHLKKQRAIVLKIAVFDNPTIVWRPLSRNLREHPHKPLESLRYVFAADSWVYLHSNFHGGLRKRMYFKTECVMAVQGHPRSLIMAPIESAYATSYWSSIVTLVVSCPVSEILQVSCWEERPHPYSTRILRCSRWTKLPMLDLRAGKILS